MQPHQCHAASPVAECAQRNGLRNHWPAPGENAAPEMLVQRSEDATQLLQRLDPGIEITIVERPIGRSRVAVEPGDQRRTLCR